VKGALDKGGVAEQPEVARRSGVALQPAAAVGEQHEREVGPFGLRFDPVGQPAQVCAGERLFRDQRKARPRIELAAQAVQVRADPRANASLAQHPGRHVRIAAGRRQDQRLFGQFRHR
jgi:hypothetical protein